MLSLRNYKIGARLIMTTIGALILMLALVGVALFNMASINETVDHLVGNNVLKTELAVTMRMRNLLIAQHVRSAIIFEEMARQKEEKNKVNQDLIKYLEVEKEIQNSIRSDKGREIFNRIVKSRKEAELSIDKMLQLISAGNRPEIESYFSNEFNSRMQVWFDCIGEYVAYQKQNTEADSTLISDLNSSTRSMMILLIVLATIVMIPSGIWVTKQITNPLRDAINVAESVARGELQNQILLNGADEPAELMLALDKMQIDLLAKREADLAIAREMARIKMALESVEVPLTISDSNNNLVFMNNASLSLWKSMEKSMKARVPGFSAENMQNHSLVDFFDDEDVKRIYREQLDSPRTLDIEMCGHKIRVTATPVRDVEGNYIGRASQWIDRTEEVEIENEVADIINSASNGDYSRKIDVSRMTGFFRQISDGINNLVDASNLSLTEVANMFSRLSKGNLTQKIEGDYSGMLGRVKDDANSTVDNLEEIIASIKSASDAISIAAKEIASGNQDLSGRTEQQASSLEETASSMEELTSTVRQNADNAKLANELAASAQKVAVKGGEVVGKVVETMTAIHQSSNRIADIIGVIDGIAFQTNILALNAAVEAARAGEQGRGFAVVATEVRNLAQRSANAAKEIKGLISDSVEKVETGNKLVNQAGRTMHEVVASIQRVAKIMADISAATLEQSQGIEQVSVAVGQMDEATQQNAALVEQAAAAAESLEEQAEQLLQAVSVFSLSNKNKYEVKEPQVALLNPALEYKGAERLEFSVKNPSQKSELAIHSSAEDEWAEF